MVLMVQSKYKSHLFDRKLDQNQKKEIPSAELHPTAELEKYVDDIQVSYSNSAIEEMIL